MKFQCKGVDCKAGGEEATRTSQVKLGNKAFF